jgi:hypothetical protein
MTNNCQNWLKILRQSFQEFVAQQAKTYNNNVYKTINYQTFLDMYLNSNKNFSLAIWCGPYYDCSTSFNAASVKQQTETNDWILLYALPLFDQEKIMRGATLIKLRLTKMDVNQCKNGDPVFSNTHKCKQNSECIFTPKGTFTSGNYKCKCKPGYINSNRKFSSYDGKTLENQYWLMKSMKNNTYATDFSCLPCFGKECCSGSEWNLFEKALSSVNSGQSTSEDDDTIREYSESNIFWNCRKYNMTLRTIIFVVQICFVLVTISIAVVIFCFRQNKVGILYFLSDIKNVVFE